MKNQLSPPRLTTSCAVPTASARVFEHPLDRVGRAELAVKIGRARRMGDHQLLLVVGDGLHSKTHRRHRNVDDHVNLLGIVPAPRNRAADVGLLMVADDDADRLVQHFTAEIVDRHLRRRHRALAGGRRGWAVHVGEHADLDDVVRNLRLRQRRCQHRESERAEHRVCSCEHPVFSHYRRLTGRRCFNCQTFGPPRQRSHRANGGAIYSALA
jgi:hypothetical protein